MQYRQWGTYFYICTYICFFSNTASNCNCLSYPYIYLFFYFYSSLLPLLYCCSNLLSNLLAIIFLSLLYSMKSPSLKFYGIIWRFENNVTQILNNFANFKFDFLSLSDWSQRCPEVEEDKVSEGMPGVSREGGERLEVGQRKVKNILYFCEKGSEFGKGIKYTYVLRIIIQHMYTSRL